MSRLRRAIGLFAVAGVMSLLLCACMMTAPGTENGTPEQIAAMSVAPELTATPAPSQTPAPEPTATDTPAPEPTATDTPTPEPTATDTPTPEPTATDTPTPEPTATDTPTPEPTATNTPTPEPTATNTPTPKPTATNTPTPEPTATNTPTPKPTKTPTPEPTATNTPTPKPTVTPTVTPKPTVTPTVTPKPTAIPTQVVGETAVVIVKSLNVRKSASTASDILGKVYEGDSFPVLGTAKDSSDRLWYRVEVVLDGVAQKGYVFGNYVSVTTGTNPEITKEPTAAPKPTETPSPKPTEKVGTPTPTPSGGKVPTASGEKVPTPPTKKSDGYPDVEGRRGVLNESECLRPGAGRIYARDIKLSTSSKVVVLETIKSEFNEIWYKVATLIDGKTVYGYLQAAAVDLDTETPKQYGSSSLKKVGTGGLSTTHGKDRDGDGVYVVVLDPGHGKQFSGAYHSNTSEHTMTLKVAKFCKEYLESNYENVKVYLTRTDENCLDKNSDIDDLERRVRYAKKKGADVLVSLHFDAFSGTVRGAEGLIPHAKKYEKCLALASQILDNLSKLNIKNLGCMTRISERSRYSYPDGDKMDAYLINRLGIESGIVTCIIEHAHMDNQKDFDEFCSTDEKLKKLAIADAKGIASYLGLKKKETSGTPTPTEKAEKTPTVKPTEKAEKEPSATPTEKAEETLPPEPDSSDEPSGE